MDSYRTQVSTVESHFDLAESQDIANNKFHYETVKCLHCEEILARNGHCHPLTMIQYLRRCEDPWFELVDTWYKADRLCDYCLEKLHQRRTSSPQGELFAPKKGTS